MKLTFSEKWEYLIYQLFGDRKTHKAGVTGCKGEPSYILTPGHYHECEVY